MLRHGCHKRSALLFEFLAKMVLLAGGRVRSPSLVQFFPPRKMLILTGFASLPSPLQDSSHVYAELSINHKAGLIKQPVGNTGGLAKRFKRSLALQVSQQSLVLVQMRCWAARTQKKRQSDSMSFCCIIVQ